MSIQSLLKLDMAQTEFIRMTMLVPSKIFSSMNDISFQIITWTINLNMICNFFVFHLLYQINLLTILSCHLSHPFSTVIRQIRYRHLDWIWWKTQHSEQPEDEILSPLEEKLDFLKRGGLPNFSAPLLQLNTAPVGVPLAPLWLSQGEVMQTCSWCLLRYN